MCVIQHITIVFLISYHRKERTVTAIDVVTIVLVHSQRLLFCQRKNSCRRMHIVVYMCLSSSSYLYLCELLLQ